jgi:hypothetical protein
MIRVWSLARLFAVEGDGTLYQATRWVEAIGAEPLSQKEARLLLTLVGKLGGGKK